MSTTNIFQISLEIWGIVLSLVLAVFSSVVVFRRGGVLLNMWTMLLLNCILLSCDAIAYVYRGDPSTVGLVVTRVSNFGVFFIQGVMMWEFAYIVQQMISGNKKVLIKSVPMMLATICVSAQLLGAILTPFTNLYYYFDEQNYYVRGSGVLLSFLLLSIVLIVNICTIYKHRKILSEKIRHTFIAFVILIALSVLVQFVFYGISLINVVLTLAIIILLINLLLDNKNQEFQCHISGMEAIINELRSNKNKEE